MRDLNEARCAVPRGTAAAPEGVAWRLFHSNAEIWPAILAECEEARESLTIQQFIFTSEGIGGRLLDLLAARARQGVHVRVLADGFGSFGLDRSERGRALVRAGGELVLFHSLPDVARNPLRRLHRLHRKTVIRDRAAAFVGGICYHDRMSDWRDTMIRIEGTVPKVASEVFDSLWDYALRKAPPPRNTGPSLGEAPWCYMLATPIKPPLSELWDALHHRIQCAEREVTLTTPYLVPHNQFRRAINHAAARGVKVRLIMPAKSDHPSLDVIGGYFARRFARRGVEIHRYQPSMIHSKIALIDGAWASVSSFNLDVSSFWLNLESGVAGTDPAYCSAIAEQLERDISNSSRL